MRICCSCNQLVRSWEKLPYSLSSCFCGMVDMEFVTFTIIIDDIVHPDGRTLMESLGGGGPQSAFGARLWISESDTRVGLAASVGPDFPESCLSWLKDMQIDCDGLLSSKFPTMRAWQILESDERRIQVWRVAVGDEVWHMLRPPVNTLPSSYKALISSAHVFSPNEKEAMSLVGRGDPLEVIKRLVELGAAVVSLRRGALGCIVHRADNGETWDIPAFHTMKAAETLKNSCEGGIKPENMSDYHVVDPTGCGNAFCGGFAVGWWKTRDLLTAGLWGSISASFMIEHEGVPQPPLKQWRSEVQIRLEMLKPFVRQLSLH